MNTKKHKSIIIVPHFDDEIFQAGGILLNYKYIIDLFITHPTDTISTEKYIKQHKMFKECIKLISEYRLSKGYEEINCYTYQKAKFNGYMSSEGRREIQNDLEKAFELNLVDDKWESNYKVDYLVFTESSTHQSHNECYHIAMSLCRSPYIEQCKDIMLATYPQSEYGIKIDSTRQINSYLPLTTEQVDILVNCIGTIYGEKNDTSQILGPENFKTYLNFFGSKCGKDFAQPYIAMRHIYTMDN